MPGDEEVEDPMAQGQKGRTSSTGGVEIGENKWKSGYRLTADQQGVKLTRKVPRKGKKEGNNREPNILILGFGNIDIYPYFYL